MSSKERVLKALGFEEPDRVPVDYWGTSETTTRLYEHFGINDADFDDPYEELLERLGVDLRIIPGPTYIGPELEKHSDGSVEDIWGVPRTEKSYGKGDKRGAYKEVVSFPLEGMSAIKEIEEYTKWPSADWFDYSVVPEQCDKWSDKAIVMVGDRLNRTSLLKPAMYLRGATQIFLDMSVNPAMAEAIFERIASFYLEYNERAFQAAEGKTDIFMMGDDYGMQNGLLCSYDMWKKYFAPGLRKYIEGAKKYGIKVMHHSCGSIKPIIPDFIDIGLDILNPVQPGVADMDPYELKRAFGDRLCFHGSINIQETLPFGTVEDVRAEVKDRMRALAPGGGFIISTAHNIQVDTPLENILALFDAYREFGEYPIDEARR